MHVTSFSFEQTHEGRHVRAEGVSPLALCYIANFESPQAERLHRAPLERTRVDSARSVDHWLALTTNGRHGY